MSMLYRTLKIRDILIDNLFQLNKLYNLQNLFKKIKMHWNEVLKTYKFDFQISRVLDFEKPINISVKFLNDYTADIKIA